MRQMEESNWAYLANSLDFVGQWHEGFRRLLIYNDQGGALQIGGVYLNYAAQTATLGISTRGGFAAIRSLPFRDAGLTARVLRAIDDALIGLDSRLPHGPKIFENNELLLPTFVLNRGTRWIMRSQ